MIFPNKLTVAYAINMAKQTLNANISSSSGAGVNAGFETERSGTAWMLIYAIFVWRLNLVKFFKDRLAECTVFR